MDVSGNLAVGSQRRRQNDEKHYQIGETRADPDVDLAIGYFRRSRPSSLDDRVTTHRLLLFDFLRGLPEEEVRTDCRAENRDDRRPCAATVWDGRSDEVAEHDFPIGAQVHCRCNVSEKEEREPLQHACQRNVSQPYGRPRDEGSERNYP